ncbi:probable LRR receptor-like serine/threonine-protein kinase [Tanacetum coccineum]
MDKTMKRYGVNHQFSTSYHPQTSGQVENTKSALKRILEKTVKDNPASWSRKLDDALWAFHTAFKTPTGTTPYKLIYGKNYHLPFKIEHRAYLALKNCNPYLIVAGEKRMFQLHELEELRHQAYENSRLYKIVELYGKDGKTFIVNGHRLKLCHEEEDYNDKWEAVTPFFRKNEPPNLRRSDAQLLPYEEVKALMVIASKLRYSGWQPTSDSQLNGLNLTGVIPEEFANLTSLREIDLSRNYLNGTIPARLGQLRLTILNILGNRISGPIPEEIGDISTLEELVVEDNLLGGQLPLNIGRLTRLRRFLASANNFTGTIPASYGHLANLTDFRIDGSNLSGRIPDFIGNWTNIERLDLQGTSMEGPIPSTISMLTKMVQLRITDLAGSRNFPFPNLQNVTTTLTLRNCFLTGPIPKYIGYMNSMKILDLSFNGLTGPIPNSFENLKLQGMYATTYKDITDFMYTWNLRYNLIFKNVPSI